MKQLVLFLLVLSSATVLCQTQQRIIDFRDIAWGSHLDSVVVNGKKVEFQRDKNSLQRNAYTIPGDVMSIGNVKLSTIDYIFNDELRFYKVFMIGAKEDATQMRFILDCKVGNVKNESNVDGVHYMQWIIKDVTFTLAEYDYLKFELVIESNWQASEAYKKNTTVEDF